MKQYKITLTATIPDDWHGELPSGAWPLKIWDDIEYTLSNRLPLSDAGFDIELDSVLFKEKQPLTIA